MQNEACKNKYHYIVMSYFAKVLFVFYNTECNWTVGDMLPFKKSCELGIKFVLLLTWWSYAFILSDLARYILYNWEH